MGSSALTCIKDAEDYRSNMKQVVQTKQTIVVAFFFTYLAFETSIFFKLCFQECAKNEMLLNLRKKM